MSENAPNIDAEDRIERAEWEAGSPPSEAVVDAIAAATGREPLQIEPLQNHVDTDALNALVTPQSDDGDTVQVSFSYEELGVLVDSSGTIPVYSGPTMS